MSFKDIVKIDVKMSIKCKVSFPTILNIFRSFRTFLSLICITYSILSGALSLGGNTIKAVDVIHILFPQSDISVIAFRNQRSSCF